MVGAIMLSPTDATSQEPVVGSAQRVIVARARAPRDTAVQHCFEYLGSYPSASSVLGIAAADFGVCQKWNTPVLNST